MPSKQYEYIIVGGGVAGLALAQAITGSDLGKRPGLILEPSPGVALDHHIGFWSKQPGAVSSIIRHQWTSLGIATPEWQETRPLGEYQFYLLHGLDYEQRVRGIVAQHGHFTYRQDRVSEIGSDAEGAFVTVNGERIGAETVFDSRFDGAAYEAEALAAGAKWIWQNSYSAVVRAEGRVFDPQYPLWLDFRLPQGEGVRYAMVLPFDQYQAYVRVVSFDAADLTSLLTSYLREQFTIQDFEQYHEERDRVPLTDYAFPRSPLPHVVRIGAAAGLSKPPFGQRFTRTQADGKAVVRALVGQTPLPVVSSTKRFRVADRVAIHLLRSEPAKMRTLLCRLLQSSPLDQVFDLVDEQMTLAELLQLVIQLPLGIVLPAWWRVR